MTANVRVSGGFSALLRPTIWLALVFIITRVAIFLWLAGRGTDLPALRQNVGQLMAGRVPFRDFFPEYPPLVYFYAAIPAAAGVSWGAYIAAFRAMTCAVDCLIFANDFAVSFPAGRGCR